jgi:hypothetical protein
MSSQDTAGPEFRGPEFGGAELERPQPARAPSGQADFGPIDAAALRGAVPARQLVGGYRPADVDMLIDVAAATIELLGARIATLQATIEELRAAPPETALSLDPSREQLAHEMFETAYRAISQVKEESRQEAQRFVAGAQAEAEEMRAALAVEQQAAEALRAQTETAIESARRELEQLEEQTEARRRQLVADATRDAFDEISGLERQKEALVSELIELRSSWVEFVGAALERLDATPALSSTSQPAAEARVVERTAEPASPDLAAPEAPLTAGEPDDSTDEARAGVTASTADATRS